MPSPSRAGDQTRGSSEEEDEPFEMKLTDEPPTVSTCVLW